MRKQNKNVPSRIDTLLDFSKEIEKANLVLRKTLCSDGKRPESNAEHSWHLAMLLLLFQKDFPRTLNVLKTLKMILIHDLVEIYAGDTFLFDTEARKTKIAREKQAAKKLFSKLPDDIEKEFIKLFNEFNSTKTKEARIAKSLDKLQPIIQNILTNGTVWKKHKITENLIDDYKRNYMVHDPIILEVYSKLIREAKDKKFI